MTSLWARGTCTPWARPTMIPEIFRGFAPTTFLEGTKVLFAISQWETEAQQGLEAYLHGQLHGITTGP